MNDPTGMQFPLKRYYLPASLAVLTIMGLCEWGLDLWLPRDAPLLGSMVRMLLATVLVGTVCSLMYHRHRRLTNHLSAMLTHQEKLNTRFQRECKEREASGQALSDQLQFLQVLIDAIPAPIFYKNAEGIYAGCNRAFEAFLGKHRDEIVGRSVYGVSPGPQAQIYHEKDIELMRQRGHQVYESQVVYADGSLHDVIFNKAAYELEGGELGGLIGVILDITERKTLERELIEAKEQAEFYSRSKTRFLTSMSHEIRTPLNAIVGFSQVLLNRSKHETLPGEFHEFLEKIAISGQGLAKLVNDVLDISRIEAGKVEAVNEDFPLRDTIDHVLISCEPQAARRGLRFNCEFDPTLPLFICSDRGKLTQILTNLVGNAVKFAPDNTIIDIRLQKHDGEKLLIEVIDHGIGIPPEQQALIFEPFEQLDNSTGGQLRGTGLGLPITRSLAALLGGDVSVESAGSVGTCFRVELPLKIGHQKNAQSIGSDDSLPGIQGITVLIFEDNALNQALMQAFCDDHGVNAIFVADADAGISRACDIRPDMILMDIHLPGLSGIDATKRIRTIPNICDTPIIGLSAAAFSEQKAAALHAGMDDYLTKPIAFPILVATIKKHLAACPANLS